MPITRPFQGSLVTPPRTSYSTDWDIDENPISELGIWRTGSASGYYQNPRSLSGIAYGANTSNGEYNDCLGHLEPSRHAIGPDHYVEAVVNRAVDYVAPDSHEIGLYLRTLGAVGAGGAFWRGYECLFPHTGAGDFQIIGWLGTSHDIDNFDLGISGTTMNGGLGTVSDGDVIKAQIVGTTIKCYKNGTQFYQVTDTRWSDGNPGIGFFIRPGGTPSSLCIKNWSAGVAT